MQSLINAVYFALIVTLHTIMETLNMMNGQVINGKNP